MNVSIVVRPEAEADIAQAFADLEQVRAGLGREFLRRVREVFERLEAMPQLYGTVWQDVRAARVKRFRYIVYYVAFADRVEVIAVIHGSWDEAAWRSRV